MRGKNRQKILEAGFDLFYQKGFEVTGVQEIATASGVPKGSFYNYFPSKTDFAVNIVQLYCERQSEYLQKVLVEGEGSPLTRLKETFETWAELFFDADSRGCLAGNLIQELANQQESIREALNEATAELESYFVTVVRQAQQTGELSEDLNTEDTGAFLYNGWQGAILRAKATQNSDPFHQFIDLVFEKTLR
mgnify:CR=1 FL=1